MKRFLMTCMVAAMCFAGCDNGGLNASSTKLQPEGVVKILEVAAPSVVVVEMTLQYDKSESPYGGEIYSAEQYIKEERPVEQAGYLVKLGKETFVVTGDPLVHSRFIKSIKVRQNDVTVPARVHSFTDRAGAMLLTLDKPIEGSKALAFNTKAAKPYIAVSAGRFNTRWSLRTSSVESQILLDDIKTPLRRMASRGGVSIVINSKGELAGLIYGQSVGLKTDAWKGDSLTGKTVAAKKVQSWLDTVGAQVGNGVYRVTLNFRSPRKGQRTSRYDSESVTEKQCFAIATDKKTVLILANLSPRDTARLEEITVHTAKGNTKATFTCSLKNYGALVAKTKAPLKGVAAIYTGDLFGLDEQLLPSLELRIQGEKIVSYPIRNMIEDYELGWRKQVYPKLAATVKGEEFLFNRQGQLVAFPISQRTKDGDSRYSYGGSGDTTTAAKYLVNVLAALDDKANIDTNNIPLTEEEENRLAWMGVYLQPMNEELARENNVATATRNGRIGALVSYVFPNSPAAKAGIEPGMILTQIHVDGEPKPHDVQGTGSPFRGGVFPWAQLDQIPEQYFDQIPTPWNAAENTLTRYLTDSGFGRKYTADFYVDGKLTKKNFTIARMPDHYGSAKRYKNKALGMTVRNLTYEARNYFRVMPKDPGVIISMIEPGSKASVGGLKPYEYITHVNDKPVADVKAFEAALKAGGELKLAIKRFTEGRVVKLELPLPKGSKPKAKPAEEKPAEAADAATTVGEERPTKDTPGKYTVKKGDTLAWISQKFYGTPKHSAAIKKANSSLDPSRMGVGTVLVIPPKPVAKKAAPKVVEEPATVEPVATPAPEPAPESPNAAN